MSAKVCQIYVNLTRSDQQRPLTMSSPRRCASSVNFSQARLLRDPVTRPRPQVSQMHMYWPVHERRSAPVLRSARWLNLMAAVQERSALEGYPSLLSQWQSSCGSAELSCPDQRYLQGRQEKIATPGTVGSLAAHAAAPRHRTVVRLEIRSTHCPPGGHIIAALMQLPAPAASLLYQQTTSVTGTLPFRHRQACFAEREEGPSEQRCFRFSESCRFLRVTLRQLQSWDLCGMAEKQSATALRQTKRDFRATSSSFKLFAEYSCRWTKCTQQGCSCVAGVVSGISLNMLCRLSGR